jgi:hypothetical protein
MNAQTKGVLPIEKNSVWGKQLGIVKQTLEGLYDETRPALLVFWASQGGGKTAFLSLISEFCETMEDTVTLGLWDVSASPPDNLVQEIIGVVERSRSTENKIVLLDNIDALLSVDDDAPFFAFEREVIHRLIEKEDILVIATSQMAIEQWREYDVRVRQKNYHIPPLTSGEVKQLAQKCRLDPQKALETSLGHLQVLTWLCREPDLTSEEIDRKVDAYFLVDMSDEAQELARVASLLPVFNVAILRSVFPLQEAETDSFYAGYVERIRELTATGLVSWDVEVGAYRFCDATVRRLLARSYRHRRPADFLRVHRLAASYYQREALRATYLHQSIVSALYHLIQLHRSEESRTVSKECLQWIEGQEGAWIGADWEAVNRAWQTGAGDPSVVEEMKSLIGEEAFDRISRLLDKAKQTTEVAL